MIEGENKYLQAENKSWPERITKINDSATICGVVIFKGQSFV
jgi:SOS-response transcriptional repressor LexA